MNNNNESKWILQIRIIELKMVNDDKLRHVNVPESFVTSIIGRKVGET